MKITKESIAKLNKTLDDMETAKNLGVVKVRYFETRRGLGYECKTNHKDVTIWNDGLGGGTYADSYIPKYRDMSESALESLINQYEKV